MIIQILGMQMDMVIMYFTISKKGIEESETVKLVSDFGKLAAKTAMRLSREICEEKGECV